jgi:hypothetical protein
MFQFSENATLNFRKYIFFSKVTEDDCLIRTDEEKLWKLSGVNKFGANTSYLGHEITHHAVRII